MSDMEHNQRDITERLLDLNTLGPQDLRDAVEEIKSLRKRLSEFALDKIAELDREIGIDEIGDRR